MDTRRCFTMETGYTSSDFSFYRKNPNSLEVTRSHIYDMQTRAGKEKWYLVDAYTHYWKSGHGSDRVLVLTNDNGVQIETCQFGWRSVTTEHELAEKRKVAYSNFLAALTECGKLCPDGASRWFNEAVLQSFKHMFEEELYYGEDE